jgi:polyphenol oxidase
MQAIQSSLLLNLPNLKHALFRPGTQARESVNFSFQQGSPREVLQARKTACALLDIEADALTHVYQVHGTDIWEAGPQHRGAGARTGENQIGQGDGLITAAANLPLAILVADCIPVFFASHNASIIGLAHAGWRGILDNINARMVTRFQTDFSVPASEIRVWIGPGISSCCFQVKEDVWTPFAQDWHIVPGALDPDRMTIDLKAIIRYQLQKSGVLEDHIDVSPHCTCCRPAYFSYRREGPGSGRNLAVIQNDV